MKHHYLLQIYLSMYQKYADINSWKFEILSISETGLKGVKEAICNISGKNVFKA